MYLDPPFYTQKTHSLSTRDRRKQYSFNDKWMSKDNYIQFLETRLIEILRILRDDGSLFFHCDRNASHMIRVLLDRLLGPNRFRSEVIWAYRRWSNARRGLLPAHQTILYYTKSDCFTFNAIKEDYSSTTNVDQITQRRGRDDFGKSVYKRSKSGKIVGNGVKSGVPLRRRLGHSISQPQSQRANRISYSKTSASSEANTTDFHKYWRHRTRPILWKWYNSSSCFSIR